MLRDTCCWRGFWKGQRVWGEKHESVRGGEEHVGGEGRAFDISFGKGRKGCWRLLAHTPYRRTQPPPPGDREREQRKETMGETENRTTGDKMQGKTGVRYYTDACIRRLHFHQLTRQQGRTSTVFYIQHTNLVFTHRQTCHTQEE